MQGQANGSHQPLASRAQRVSAACRRLSQQRRAKRGFVSQLFALVYLFKLSYAILVQELCNQKTISFFWLPYTFEF